MLFALHIMKTKATAVDFELFLMSMIKASKAIKKFKKIEFLLKQKFLIQFQKV
jgi:hypothetical protein